jgi:hypothetical protein
MKDTQFNQLIELSYQGGGFIPANENAEHLAENCGRGEVISFIEVTNRDLKFHKAYMGFISYIWGYLPKSFKNAVPKKNFYLFLKHLKGQYDVLYSFKDGTKLVQYESISFGNMSQKRFEDYVREQLPWIYENIIHQFFQDENYNSIIETIEEDWKKFLSKV